MNPLSLDEKKCDQSTLTPEFFSLTPCFHIPIMDSVSEMLVNGSPSTKSSGECYEGGDYKRSGGC